MTITARFQETLREVEASEHFLPFVGGEASRVERRAIAAKRVLGLADGAAVDPYAAATFLRVPVVGQLSQFAVVPDPMRSEILGSNEWSAGTLEGPLGPMVILNPTHSETRLKATLAEEISHLVMGHPPSKIDAAGVRTYNATVEQEAFSVGGALVMPYGQVFRLAKNGAPIGTIAETFGVSPAMAQYRVNRTGLSRMHKKRVGA